MLIRQTARRAKEPPSRPSPDALKFIITRDASDNWIVMEMHGLYGGVFISRDAAVHFADLECRDREATFEVVTGRIERLESKMAGIAMRKLASNFRCWAAQALRGPVPDRPRRQRQRSFVDGREDGAPPVIHEALSDDGPYHRLTDAEARWQAILACCFLAAGILAMIIWH